MSRTSLVMGRCLLFLCPAASGFAADRAAEKGSGAVIKVLGETFVPGRVRSIDPSPTGDEFVVGLSGDRPHYRHGPKPPLGTIAVLRASDATVLRKVEFDQTVAEATWSPDGRRIVVSLEGIPRFRPGIPLKHANASVTVLDASNLWVEHRIPREDLVQQARIAHDGRTLVAVVRLMCERSSRLDPERPDGGVVEFWDVGTWELSRSITLRERLPRMALAGDSLVLVGGPEWPAPDPDVLHLRVPDGEVRPCGMAREKYTDIHVASNRRDFVLTGNGNVDVYDARLSRRLSTIQQRHNGLFFTEYTVDSNNLDVFVLAQDGYTYLRGEEERTTNAVGVRCGPNGDQLCRKDSWFAGRYVRQLPNAKGRFIVGGDPLGGEKNIAVLEVSVTKAK